MEITPGTTETYRIRVINDGPSVADDVVVTDALPDGLTATAWRVESVTPPGPTPACVVATATCALGDLPPGTTVELELDVLVDADLVIDPAVGVANTATVTSDTDDPNDADNTSTFTASGGAQADLSIRKSAPPSFADRRRHVAGTLADRTFLLRDRQLRPVGRAEPACSPTCCRPGMTFVRVLRLDDPDFDLSPLIACTGDRRTRDGDRDVHPALRPPGRFVGIFASAIEFTVDPTVPDGTVLDEHGDDRLRRRGRQPRQQHLHRPGRRSAPRSTSASRSSWSRWTPAGTSCRSADPLLPAEDDPLGVRPAAP